MEKCQDTHKAKIIMVTHLFLSLIVNIGSYHIIVFNLQQLCQGVFICLKISRHFTCLLKNYSSSISLVYVQSIEFVSIQT